MVNKSFSVRNITYIAVFTSLMSTLSPLAIPLPGGVPISLQPWLISLAGIILGPRHGTVSTLLYITLGAIGLPVFANFAGGFGIILGPTGGFIMTFPILSLFSGIGAKKGNIIFIIIGQLVGTVFNFVGGSLWFMYITGASLQTAIVITILPFLVFAMIRIIALPFIAMAFKFALLKSGVTI